MARLAADVSAEGDVSPKAKLVMSSPKDEDSTPLVGEVSPTADVSAEGRWQWK